MKAAKTENRPVASPPEQLLTDAARVTLFLENLFDDMAGDDAMAPELVRAMRYGAGGGGKRIRAGLVMGAARLAGHDDNESESVLRVAAAFECLHAYSLIHDDLPAMDDAATRRGKPSCHAAFGIAAAILAGDALQSLAFELLTDPRTHADGAVRAALAHELAFASGAAGMAGGQMLDLSPADFDMDATMRMQSMKTGALITAAARCGGMIGGGDAHLIKALGSFGRHIGLAFQIADDVLDRTATDIGKPVGHDREQGKASLADHLGGVDAAAIEAEKLAGEAVAALRSLGAASNTHLDYMAELADFITRRGH